MFTGRGVVCVGGAVYGGPSKIRLHYIARVKHLAGQV